MKCSRCGKNVFRLRTIRVGEERLCPDCYRKNRADSHRPDSSADARGADSMMPEDRSPAFSGEPMTLRELNEYAFAVVEKNILEADGVKAWEELDPDSADPALLCERFSRKTFIAIRMALYPEDNHPLYYPERLELLKRAGELDAGCYYVDVQLRSRNRKRAEAGLFLKGDELQV